jgi:RND family efflux transporter MFP subunit
MHKRRIFHFAITILIVAFGAFGMYALTASKPEIEMRKPEVPLPLVRVMEPEVSEQPVFIRSEGTVRPLREVELVPQVGGKVVYVSPSLVNGGEFKEGEVLLRIEPEDYELAVTLAEARIKDAESRLKLAREEAASAREEWNLLYKGTTRAKQSPPPLVAKEPQLEAARAQLEADRADLRRAMLNLERTQIKAPFQGRVSNESVGIGQYVSPGQSVARIYDTEAAEIMLPLESEDLFWIEVPGFTNGKGPGSPALIEARVAGQWRQWQGRVVRAEGELDERTRMINVIVRVDDPYATRPPLAVGMFVSAKIEGRILPGAAAIPRAALRAEQMVWVVKDDRLQFRPVDVAYFHGDEAIVSSGIEDGDRVVLTPLREVTDGMRVRTELQKQEEQR